MTTEPDRQPTSASLTRAARLRQRLAEPRILRTLGVHDVFSALLAEQAGLEMLFLGGFGVAASMLGLPDLGLLTLTEMTTAVRNLCTRVRIPVIADGDTGHGEAENVARTVREFESAGAAGMLLEDQVSPKRCGHFAGKQVIPRDHMLDKLKAALDARRDPNFIILARTDARAIEGLDAAIDRMNAYRAAGADACFIEAPESIEELRRIPREVPAPHLANMLTGGRTPILGCDELEALGYRIAVCPIETLLMSGYGIRRLLAQLLDTGRVDTLASDMMTFEEVKQLLRAAVP